MTKIMIRPMATPDIPAVLQLMQALAEFEQYSDQFKVTELALFQRSQLREPDFYCLVAADSCNTIYGYAVLTFHTFTYDLVATATLKELLVHSNARGRRIGSALFNAVIAECQHRGLSRLNWTVLQGNVAAAQFYQQHGGQPSAKWILYEREIAPV